MLTFKIENLWRSLSLFALSLLMVTNVAWADSASKHKQFTTDFNSEACTFSADGGNAYFTLDPTSDPILLEGEEDQELVQVKISVLNLTEPFYGLPGFGDVVTRVIKEEEWIDGELVEVSLNYFSRCIETNDIYYFGEYVEIYEDGEINHDGEWRAGVDGAMPGIIMPGTFLLGARYYQEIAPEMALDRAENIDMSLEIETPAGTYPNCVKTEETSPLEPNAKDIKIYAPGYGIIVDAAIERVDEFTEL